MADYLTNPTVVKRNIKMKKLIKSIAGVTLLEIMLVLAIASLVIVMSIRYYTNATAAENINIIIESTQNIAAAMDNLSSTAGNYSTVSTSALSATVGSANMKTPYGSTITVGSNTGGTYVVSIPSLPSAVCLGLVQKLKSNSKFTSPTCTGTTVTYTYNISS
jgi:type II secretory pathway pseudopilin PulG